MESIGCMATEAAVPLAPRMDTLPGRSDRPAWRGARHHAALPQLRLGAAVEPRTIRLKSSVC